MRAAIISGLRQVQIIEVPVPQPLADEAAVEIALCGICGTDVHAYQSGNPYNPAICGHEWVGTVSAAGNAVRNVSEGDRVVVAVPPPCGACVACHAGNTLWCSSVFLSATGRDVKNPAHGGFAPSLAVKASRLVKAHAGLSDVEAAQVEPATVAFHAVRASRIRLGDVAVVQGAGPIGLTTMQWVKAAGAGEVIVIEPNEQRRSLAAELGATVVCGAGAEADQIVREHTNGLGADVVYECVGRAPAVQSAADLVRRGGSVCLIGLSDTPASIVPGVWLVKEIQLTAALAYTHEEFDLAMGMIADGRVKLAPMHSSTATIDTIDAAIADLASGQSTETKVLVDPRL